MIRVCKPNSVPGKSRTAVIYLVPKLLSGSSGLPEGVQGEQPCPEKNSGNLLLDLAPSGVCRIPFNRDPVHHGTFNITIEAVGSYPAFSPLPAEGGLSPRSTGSIFSVALSVYRKNQHPGSYPALRSAEFGLSSPDNNRGQLLNTNH